MSFAIGITQQGATGGLLSGNHMQSLFLPPGVTTKALLRLFAAGPVLKLICFVFAGLLFQFPGLLLASLAGVGAANFLKHPAPWLHGLTSGGKIACCYTILAQYATCCTGTALLLSMQHATAS